MTPDIPQTSPDSSAYIAEFLATTRYEQLPASVVQSTKAAILDTLGCALVGAGNREIVPFDAYVRSDVSGPGSTLLGSGGKRAIPEHAVLRNCAAMHQFDFDDTFDIAPCHPSSGSVISSLAVAESLGGVSGREWIAAVALANELTCRLSLAIRGKVHDYPWFRAPIVGIFGATAAAARIMGCTAAEHLQALGLTLPTVGGTFASLQHPGSDVRSVRDGIAYRNGVLAAQLAKNGLRGDQQVFDGPMGFFNVYFLGKYERSVLIEALGEKYHAQDVSLKPWPSIRHVHTALTAVHEIISRTGLRCSDIAKVRVHVGEITRQRCVPVARGGLPGSRMDLLANLPFAVANMITHGNMPLEAYRDNALADKVIDAMEQKVEWVFDARMTVRGTFEPSCVEILAVDGQVHTSECQVARGHPGNPMSDAQRHEKFAACARLAPSLLDDERIRATIALVDNLDNVNNVTEVSRLLA